MDTEIRQIMMGLPEVGKTTFLAALWHLVESTEVSSALRLTRLEGVRDYLNKIRSDWMNCKPLERTLIGSEREVFMDLQNTTTGRATRLMIPDLSGESFRLQWEKREWTREYHQLASAASGVLLFVHPRKVIEPTPISPATKALEEILLKAIPGVERTEPFKPTASDEPLTTWTPDKSPTQVQLVELLQFLLAGPFSNRTFRLAIIVSAWDLLANQHSPKEWLSRRLPLFSQYVISNPDKFQYEVFGVSAQGGELVQSDTLLAKSRPSERIMVIVGDVVSHDITLPVQWVMGEW
jgi:hypothetical protein